MSLRFESGSRLVPPVLKCNREAEAMKSIFKEVDR